MSGTPLSFMTRFFDMHTHACSAKKQNTRRNPLYLSLPIKVIIKKLFWSSRPLTSLGKGGLTSPPIFKIPLKNYFTSIPSY